MLLAHLEQVCAIEGDVQGMTAWTRQMFVEELNNPASKYWVAEDAKSKKVLGFIGFHEIDEEGYITNLSVHADFQGQRIGERLLATLIQKALDWHLRYLTLEVREGNLRAQNLYKKYGFDIKGLRPAYYRDNQENALIMWTPDLQSRPYKEHFEAQKNLLLKI